MTEFRADLHCHSQCSDGTDTPHDLIEIAINIGLSGLSITDHDTTAAYKVALDCARQKDFSLLPGIEFSAAFRGEPVHILGYAYELNSPLILELCARHQKRREERNLRILNKLHKLGMEITLQELDEAKGNDEGSCGRPHIAYALFKKKKVNSIQQAFELYLAEGKPAYDAGEPISVEETIDVIHKGKGKAILAHPHLIKRSTTVRALLAMPFDGLEGYYARLSPQQEKKWLDIARLKNWLITGGSDYHGTRKPQAILGSSWVGKETFEILYAQFLENNKNGIF